MFFPGSADLMFVPPDQVESRTQSSSTEAVVLRYLNLWFKPELGFPLNMVHMHVQAAFLP
jgi:hypothetical protein